MNEHIYVDEDNREQWRIDLEEMAYEEWCRILEADPYYPIYLESLNHQEEQK